MVKLIDAPILFYSLLFLFINVILNKNLIIIYMDTSTPQILESSTPQFLDTTTSQSFDTAIPLNKKEQNQQVQELTEKYDTLIKAFYKIQNFPYDKKDMSNEEILEIFTNLKKLKQFSQLVANYIPNLLEDYII
jgi:hypothetical protein